MARMLELSDEQFKITAINTLTILVEKAGKMQKTGNISREM